METKKKVIYAVILLAILGVAGFLYKDDLLVLAGFGGGAEEIEMIDVPEVNVPAPTQSAESSVDSANNAQNSASETPQQAQATSSQEKAHAQPQQPKAKKSPKQALDAIKALLEPCQNKDAKSCAQIAEIYSDDLEDSALSVAFGKKACDFGSIDGCYQMGVKYYNGSGVSRDVKQSFALFKKACDGEKIEGCNNLGVLYNNGEGTKQDIQKARQLFKKACDSGYKPSCENLKKIK